MASHKKKNQLCHFRVYSVSIKTCVPMKNFWGRCTLLLQGNLYTRCALLKVVLRFVRPGLALTSVFFSFFKFVRGRDFSLSLYL